MKKMLLCGLLMGGACLASAAPIGGYLPNGQALVTVDSVGHLIGGGGGGGSTVNQGAVGSQAWYMEDTATAATLNSISGKLNDMTVKVTNPSAAPLYTAPYTSTNWAVSVFGGGNLPVSDSVTQGTISSFQSQNGTQMGTLMGQVGTATGVLADIRTANQGIYGAITSTPGVGLYVNGAPVSSSNPLPVSPSASGLFGSGGSGSSGSVTVTSSVLPTGAATDATLTSIFAQLTTTSNATSQAVRITYTPAVTISGTLPAFASAPAVNQGTAGSTAWATHDTQTANVYDATVYAALTTGAKVSQGTAGSAAWYMAITTGSGTSTSNPFFVSPSAAGLFGSGAGSGGAVYITTGAGTSVANPLYMIQAGTNFAASSISTYANVNAGATWTSAIEQAYQYPYFQFSIATDQPFTAYVDQLDENSNVNRTSAYPITFTTGSIYTVLGNVTVIDNSIRVRITNNGASNTTTMDMSASYGNLQAGVPVTCSVLDNQKTALNELNGTVVSTGNGVSNAGNLRVNIASDNTPFLVNLGLGGSALSATNGAFFNDLGNYSSSSYLTTCAGATNATNIKASAGSIVGMWASNTSGSVQYIKLYNKATAPTVGTDVPILTIGVPANGGFINPVPATASFPFSIGIGTATTANSGDTDTTAVAAGTLKFIILYK